MPTITLRKVGDSFLLAVPPALVRRLRLRAGDRVEVSVSDGGLVVQAPARPRYTLQELLDQCADTGPPPPEDRAWLDGKFVGREVV